MTVAWGRAMRGPLDAGLDYGFNGYGKEERISNDGSISLPPVLPALPSTVRGRGSTGVGWGSGLLQVLPPEV